MRKNQMRVYVLAAILGLISCGLLTGVSGCSTPPDNNGSGVVTNENPTPPPCNIITNWQDAYTNNLVSPTNKPPVD